MRCEECGADMGDETCMDRFHALLVAESHSQEAADMHGLTVLTYHVQHPSLTKPWYQVACYGFLRRIFEEGREGRDWEAIITEGGMKKRQADVTRWKATIGPEMPPEIVTQPVAGEMTIADIDPAAPPGHSERVLAWARSVAERRVLK
ncbi:MAG TPA: DUF5946 family protein [Chloroflexia bacterium]|jgi:hypothetical protein